MMISLLVRCMACNFYLVLARWWWWCYISAIWISFVTSVLYYTWSMDTGDTTLKLLRFSESFRLNIMASAVIHFLLFNLTIFISLLRLLSLSRLSWEVKAWYSTWVFCFSSYIMCCVHIRCIHKLLGVILDIMYDDLVVYYGYLSIDDSKDL